MKRPFVVAAIGDRDAGVTDLGYGCELFGWRGDYFATGPSGSTVLPKSSLST